MRIIESHKTNDCNEAITIEDHWHNIGWPEDKEPVKKLERALEYMGAPHRSVSGADAGCTEAV